MRFVAWIGSVALAVAALAVPVGDIGPEVGLFLAAGAWLIGFGALGVATRRRPGDVALRRMIASGSLDVDRKR